MDKIPQETIDRIKEAADIVEVVGDFVGLRKKGVNYASVCPFHDDTSPSMYVSPAKQLFNCFACGAVIKFVMEYEKKSFPEALRYLAKKYGIEIPEVELSREEIEREKRRESLSIILNKAQEIFARNLAGSAEAKAYLRETRGISPEVLEEYCAGLAVSGNQLCQALHCNHYDTELIIASGLACRSGQAGSLSRSRI